MAPAAEALMHCFPLAVPLRQVAPVCARPQNPQTPVDEQTIIRSRTSRVASFPRQQWRDPRPLRLGQLISLRRHHLAPCRITELYESAIKPLGNPECRSVLAVGAAIHADGLPA